MLLVEGQPKRFHINMMKRYFQAETTAGCSRVNKSSEMVKCLETVKEHFEKPQGVNLSEGQRRCLETVRAHYADLHKVHKGSNKRKC